MKVFVILTIVFLSSSNFGADAQDKYFNNPILDHPAADPCIIKHEGFYYMVYTEGNRITLLKNSILSNFRNAERRTIYNAPPGRANLWAPEIHSIWGGLYIYFTMDDGVADENHRMYVIQSKDPRNPMGDWSTETRLLPDEEIYAIDGTVLQYGDGNLYFIWTGFPIPPGSMNLYIAKMENPTVVKGPRTLLRFPKSPWEMHGYPVNEGPWIIQNAGRTFVVFSGSSTFTPDYCLGIFGIDQLKNPLVASNWWNDVDYCVFWRNDAESVFGTGHASFVRSPDDSELWMVYHAVNGVNDNGVNRTARIQKIEWNPDNAPRFPRPIGLNTPIVVPRGE
jgi:GH43 family beta-xylosidase